MLCDTQPERFNTLIRLSGFSHGTDVWLGNARDLIVSGTATVDSTVGCRDDIMLYLMAVSYTHLLLQLLQVVLGELGLFLHGLELLHGIPADVADGQMCIRDRSFTMPTACI